MHMYVEIHPVMWLKTVAKKGATSAAICQTQRYTEGIVNTRNFSFVLRELKYTSLQLYTYIYSQIKIGEHTKPQNYNIRLYYVRTQVKYMYVSLLRISTFSIEHKTFENW